MNQVAVEKDHLNNGSRAEITSYASFYCQAVPMMLPLMFCRLLGSLVGLVMLGSDDVSTPQKAS